MIPITFTYFSAAEATATSKTYDNTDGRILTFEIATTGFSGTIDIDGSLDGTNWTNVRYAAIDATGALSYVIAQLSYTTATTRKFWGVTDYWPYLRVDMTRSAGSVTVKSMAVSRAATA